MGQQGTEAGSDERTVHLVRLDGFCMDRTEVTRVGEATPWVGLSFDEAVAACGKRDARLPTEAEWEKAARGGCELGGDPVTCTAEEDRKSVV
jgi:formylglycine-generating enzyme required for sulfatase activity